MRIVSMRVDNDVIEFMAVGAIGEADEEQIRLYRMNLFGDRLRSTEVGYPWSDVHLDARVHQESVNTVFNLSSDYPAYIDAGLELFIIQGGGSPDPGTYIPYTRVGTTITLDENMLGGDVWYGYVYVSNIVLPDFDVSDASGIIQNRASLRITDLDVTLTGHVDVRIKPKYGTPYPTQSYRGKGSEGGTSIGYVRDGYRVQVKQDSTNIENLSLYTFSHVGLKIHQIEYRGTYHKAGRRF